MQDFVQSDTITEAVNKALALFDGLPRGSVVPWEQIEQATGILRESQHWTAFNRRFRRDFREATGIVLWWFKGCNGLKLTTTQEQLNVVPLKRQQRALRQVARGAKELAALPDADLSDHQRAAKYVRLNQIKNSRRAVLYSVRLTHALIKKDAKQPRTKPRVGVTTVK